MNVTPNVLFASDGTFAANMGCNGAGGTYEDNAGTLTLTFDVMTDAICDGDSEHHRRAYFQCTERCSRPMRVDGNNITLMAGDKGNGAYASPE